MASHRIGETGLSDSGPSNHHVSYSLFHGITAPSTSFMYVRVKRQSSSLFYQNLIFFFFLEFDWVCLLLCSSLTRVI